MATVVLNSIIKIGSFKPFRGVNEVLIKKSLRNYCDTAIVKLPATAALKESGAAQTKSVLTAQQFKRGDKIKIQLGYDGKMQTEFEGFVARINKSSPCELECEGYAFLLREITFNESFRAASLKEILQKLISGTEIKLGEDLPDVPFVKLSFEKENGFNVLKLLQKDCGDALAIWFEGNVLNANLIYTTMTEKQKVGKADAVYKIGYNIVRDGQMKERLAGDAAYGVELYTKLNDGKIVSAQVGVKNSNFERKKLQAMQSPLWQKALANEKLKGKSYDGFEGKLTGFLQPFYKPGAKLKIIDPKYPERSGNYLVEATEVKYGTGGARRTAEISIKI